MNKEQAIRYMPFIKALAEGKEIQFKDLDDKWESISSPSFITNEYRVKPEPRECWTAFSKETGKVIHSVRREDNRLSYYEYTKMTEVE